MSAVRTFAVVDVRKMGKCQTKFKSGRYTGKAAVNAALKAFNELCRLKKIRGVCTLTVSVRETTRGSDGKVFTYKLHRMKLKEPLVRFEGTPKEFTINYKNVAKSITVDSLKACRKPEGKSSGRMRAYRKKSKKTVNNKTKKVVKGKKSKGKKSKAKRGKIFGLF